MSSIRINDPPCGDLSPGNATPDSALGSSTNGAAAGSIPADVAEVRTEHNGHKPDIVEPSRDLTSPTDGRIFDLELSMSVRLRSIRLQLNEMKLDMKGRIAKLQRQPELDNDERHEPVNDHNLVARLSARSRRDACILRDSSVRGVGESRGCVSTGLGMHSSTGVRQLCERIERMEENERQLKREAKEQRLRADKLAQLLNTRRQVANVTKLRQLASIRKQTEKIKQIVVELREDIHKSSQTSISTDHLSRLRELHDQLKTKLIAASVARKMYELNALTLDELEAIVLQRDRTKAAKTLLKILLEQPELALYECFLESLRLTNQEDVYMSLKFPEHGLNVEHAIRIQRHYLYLVENIDPLYSGLIPLLFSRGVIDASERYELEAEHGVTRCCERLLSIVSRKPADSFERFLSMLDESGQEHVAERIRGSSVGVQPSDRDATNISVFTNGVTIGCEDRRLPSNVVCGDRHIPTTCELDENDINGTDAEASGDTSLLDATDCAGSEVDQSSCLVDDVPMTWAEHETIQQQVDEESENARVERGDTSGRACVTSSLNLLAKMELTRGALSGAVNMSGRIVIAVAATSRLKVYSDSEPYERLPDIRINGLCNPVDIVGYVSDDSTQLILFVADDLCRCVWRIAVGSSTGGDGAASPAAEKWIEIASKPWKLSMTSSHRITLTTDDGIAVFVFDEWGALDTAVPLPSHLYTLHAVETPGGRFIASCVGRPWPDNTKSDLVVELDRQGNILRTFGDRRGHGPTSLDMPTYLVTVDPNSGMAATDDDRVDWIVIVADLNNRRVLMLNRRLQAVGVLLAGVHKPSRVCSTDRKDRMLVCDVTSVGIYQLTR